MGKHRERFLGNSSRIGNILACGCSYTKPLGPRQYQENIKEFWPELLAKDLGLECINAGASGIGNDRIVNKTLKRFWYNT